MKKELSKIFTEDQCEAIKEAIIDSMRSVYIDMGALPGNGLEPAASLIAESVIQNAQKILSKKEIKTKKNVRK